MTEKNTDFICTKCGTDMEKTGIDVKVIRTEWDTYRKHPGYGFDIDDTNTTDDDTQAHVCRECSHPMTAKQIEEFNEQY